MAPLPSFSSDYPTITISELTRSPDSSCYHPAGLEQASLARGRKRSNSGKLVIKTLATYPYAIKN